MVNVPKSFLVLSYNPSYKLHFKREFQTTTEKPRMTRKTLEADPFFGIPMLRIRQAAHTHHLKWLPCWKSTLAGQLLHHPAGRVGSDAGTGRLRGTAGLGRISRDLRVFSKFESPVPRKRTAWAADLVPIARTNGGAQAGHSVVRRCGLSLGGTLPS